jgi:electron transfer flavoprotein alpha subunit
MSAQDIAVLVEIQQGEIAPITFELLGGARELAQSTGGEVLAIVLGQEAESYAAKLNVADRILLAEDPLLTNFIPNPYVQILEQVVLAEQPKAIMLGSTSIGIDLATLLSSKLNAPLVQGVVKASATDTGFAITSQLYSGKILADVEVNAPTSVLLTLPGNFHATETAGKASVEKVEVATPLDTAGITFEEMILPEAGDVDITQQDVLIAVGRGIQQEDNLEMAEELAQALNGAICASRPIVDQGWLPATRQVGKSGMTVQPKCYLALGISGAPEHQEGMKNANLIIAINSDENAPIFNIAHYGVVTDLFDVAPVLQEKMLEKKGVA